MSPFGFYIKALKQHKPAEITEHTLRPALQQLLEAVSQNVNSKIKIILEPKRIKDYGAPDFKLTLHEGILGYVENKALGANLEDVLESEQIERYKKLSDNILLTNYLDWIWIKNSKIQRRVSLCSLNELLQTKHHIAQDKEQQVKELIQNYLSTAPQGVDSPKTLAKALGQRGQLLKTYLYDELNRQEREDKKGKLWGLYSTFRQMVDHELKLDDFTDTFAQMLVYGLFMARLNSESNKIDLFNVEKYIPTSFELIHELVGFLKVLDQKEYAETRWIVEEVLAVLNTMDLLGITSMLSFDKNNKKADPETARDPYIYFYEDFLAAYDKALKKARGVYYTPPAVVNFIIRAVNDVLKDTFNIPEGLADHKKVTLLDFACGTGTFLLEAIRQILGQTPRSKRDLIVKDHILKNLYGFEYMIAPYTVAHLKLTQYLKDRKYDMEPEERFKIFLTNTLEHFEVEDERLLPALSSESKQAKTVKDNPILVITGNPPYNYVSKNNGQWIKEKVKDYYYFDGQPLGEENPKALQDDYVKFIRFAQWKIDQEKAGVVAIITNHTFLDSPTLKGMRQSLAKTFNQMYFLDLHGSSKKKEKAPDGSKDENVFDIKQGVCISILIKQGAENKQQISDMFGTRKNKYKILNNLQLDMIEWRNCAGMFDSKVVDKSDMVGVQYHSYVAINEIFRVGSSGIKTHRDHFAIAFSPDVISSNIKSFTNKQVTDLGISEQFKITDTRDWKLSEARNTVRNFPNPNSFIKPIQYRPFDYRHVFYDESIVELPRKEVMNNMEHDNVALLVGRAGLNVDQATSWNLVFCSCTIIDVNIFYRGGEKFYPLETNFEMNYGESAEVVRSSNVKADVINQMKATHNVSYDTSDNALFGYMYAILHSPTYRSKYKGFLKTDYPRIPLCKDYATFVQLSELGWSLINAHLMKSNAPRKEFSKFGQYPKEGNHVVENVSYTENLQRLSINKTQYFAPIPLEIYNFHIGGYQVLYKYLNDRKGRTLTLDEINNVENIVRILAFTLKTMQEIDNKTKDWI